MDRIQDDAAAQFSASTVTLAIVLLRMPIGQILPHLDPRRNHPPDSPFLEKSFDLDEARVEAQVTTDQRDKVPLLHRLQKTFDPFEAICERFLNKEMATVLCGL